MKAAKVRKLLECGKAKKKCCRSKPRCKKCPVVLKRMVKAGGLQLSDQQLKKVLVQARKY